MGVLFVNSDFFLVSGFKMKFLALLLFFFIIGSQGRVLREKRETEESLVDVAAEQENDMVEKKDEGLNNDSLEDVKARGPALSKLVKAIVKNIPDGAVQKVKDAAVELVKGTVKKHLGLEGGDSVPEEPARDIVVETDVKEGDTNENLKSLPEKQSEEDEDEDEEGKGKVKQKRDADEDEDEDEEEEEVKQKRDADEKEDEDKKEEKEVKQKRDVDEDHDEDEEEDEDEGEVIQKRDADEEVDEDKDEEEDVKQKCNADEDQYEDENEDEEEEVKQK